MSKTKKNAKIKSMCVDTCKKGSNKEPTISCFVCKTWFHSNCVGLTATQYKTIQELGDQIEWFCSSCISDKNSSIKNQNIEHSMNELSSQIANLSEKFQILQKTTCTVHQTTQQKTTQLSYADIIKAKTISNLTSTNQASGTINTDTSKDKDNSECYLLMVKGFNSDNFNKLKFKIELIKQFPKIKIKNIYIKSNNIINIFFHNNNDLEMVKNGWQPNLFTEKTTVIDLQTHLLKHEAYHIILKDVPKEFTEAQILNELQSQYNSCLAVERFIKNGKALHTLKCTLKDKKRLR